MMTTSDKLSTFSVYEGNIDRNRIVYDALIPDEYFCPICQDLLWKPRSCASCQQVFCQKCICTWLKNPISAKTCPFRCPIYEDRRCPPFVHSSLARLNIRCRNSSFGCTEVLPYNSLEQHETVECEYLTEQCLECDQLVLVSELDEHRQTPGLCVPHPIKCTFCQNHFEKTVFPQHFHKCFKKKMDSMFEQPSEINNVQTIGNYPTLVYNWLNIQNKLEEQRELSSIPTNLIGIDAVRQARARGCGIFYHIFLMLTFILANGLKAPFFILLYSCIGLVAVTQMILTGYFLIIFQIGTRLYRGISLIMLFSYMLSHGVPLYFRTVSDSTTIYFFDLFIFLYGCCDRTPVEMFQTNDGLSLPLKINLLLCCAGILAMKIILLLCRFYYWIIPTYLTAGIVAWISFYIAFRCTHSLRNPAVRNTIQTTTAT